MFENLSSKIEKALHTLKGKGSITDINVAGARAIREAVQQEKCAMTDLMNLQVEAVKAETIKKMKLFGSEGKA